MVRMQKRRKGWWRLTVIIAIALVVLTFTPLVTPAGKHTPALIHFPYTLWTGIIISLGLTLLTLLAAIFHPGSKNE